MEEDSKNLKMETFILVFGKITPNWLVKNCFEMEANSTQELFLMVKDMVMEKLSMDEE